MGLGQGPRNLILGHILPHQVILMMMQIWETQQDGKAIMDKRMQSSSYKAGLQVQRQLLPSPMRLGVRQQTQAWSPHAY